MSNTTKAAAWVHGLVAYVFTVEGGDSDLYNVIPKTTRAAVGL